MVALATWGQRKIVLKVKKQNFAGKSSLVELSVDDFKEKVQSPIVIGYTIRNEEVQFIYT